ncbi:hypothetical protein GQ457_18G001960 [Hibiscus cannabinus]
MFPISVKDSGSTGLVFNCAGSSASNSWILDSGATDHIVSDVRFFEDLTPVDKKFVKLPDNTLVKVVSIGTVRLSSTLVLRNAFFIPNFSINLVSVSQLVKDVTLCLIFSSSFCFIQDIVTWEMIGLARLINGLYVLEVSFSSVNTCNVAASSISSSVVSVSTWHARLDHPSKQRIKCFSDINKEISVENFPDCEVCHLAKQKRLSFPLSITKSDCVFDLVHMDIWGPFPVKSIYGHSYFLTVVDDKSRFFWVFPMTLKSETRDLVIQFF